MTHRWIGHLLLLAVMTLAACVPQQQGGGASGAPSDAAPDPTVNASVQPTAPSSDPAGDEYDYDY